MTDPAFPNLFLIRHPLVQHKLTRLRDRHTGIRDFKDLVHEISMLLAYEATMDLPLEPVPVETPLETTVGQHVAGKKLALVPILRAGLGMVEGITAMVPHARVGHIGVYRNEDTLEPVDYYFKIPGSEESRLFLVLDPMLATGGSAVATVDILKRWGVHRIKFVALLAAPEGVENLQKHHPEVPIHLGALDSHLNDIGYIVPGLGDAGDRQFGTG